MPDVDFRGVLAFGLASPKAILEKTARKDTSRALMAQRAWTQELAVKEARNVISQEIRLRVDEKYRRYKHIAVDWLHSLRVP